MAKRIIVTDADLTGDEIIYTTRRALPMTISGLSAGMWYLLNTTMSEAISVAAAPVEPGDFARTASTNSTRSIHSGHSLTDTYINLGPWPNNTQSIVESLGYTDMWDKAIQSTVPGSTIQYRYEHEDTIPEGHRAYSEIDQFHTLMITEGGPPPRTTSDGMVNTLDYFCRFAANTIENGAGNEVILWSIWPALNGPGTSPENPTPTGDWVGYTFRTGLPEYENSFKYMADYATWKMHQLYPSLPEDWRVWLIPGHKWMERVYDDVQNDLVPGITDMQQLFGQPDNPDDDIHPSTTGSYGISCLVATCMYQVNLTEEENVWIMPEFEDHQGVHPAVPQALAEYFWQIAWEIATAYEPVGMGGTEGAALRWQPSDGDPMPNWTLANPNTDPNPDPDPEPGDLPETVFLLNNDGSGYDGPTPSTALPALDDGAYTFTNQTVIDVPTSRTTYICAAIWTGDPATSVGGSGLEVRLDGANEWTNPKLVLNVNYGIAQIFWSALAVNGEHDRFFRVEFMGDNPHWRVVELLLDGNILSSLPSADSASSMDIMLDNEGSGFEALDDLGRVAFPAQTTDVRFAFVAYAQEIPDAGGRAAMRAEAQAAIARAEA